MILDLIIEQRLSNCRIVHFAMPVAPESYDINDDAAGECIPVLQRNLSSPNHGVRVVGINMEDWDRKSLRHVRGVSRRARLGRFGSEAEKIVRNDVYSPANREPIDVCHV